MTSSSSRLEPRLTGDGSFSLYSAAFGEAFHNGGGAMAEADAKFVGPAGLERWSGGTTLRVLDVCVGTGSNTAALLEACARRGLRLEWWGLEIDPEPLELALADARFRSQWSAATLTVLRQLAGSAGAVISRWQDPQLGGGALLWGDGRRRLPELLQTQRGQLDLVLMDAFSPGRCPQLWTESFLNDLAACLAPRGRLLTYCCAAAVRRSLLQAGLQIASISAACGLQQHRHHWSGGTAASPCDLSGDPRLRPLSRLEREHLATNAAEPYRDPDGQADRATILRLRQQAQQSALALGTVEPTSRWRRRWGLERTSGGQGNHL